jgi:hypothetical protein
LSSSPTTFPSGKFFIVVAPGTAQEEKMCVTLSGSTLTVVDPNSTSTSASSLGRGVDNTTARSSIAGGATVYPVATAIDFDEANELTSKYAAQGSIVYQGSTTFAELPIGTAGYALLVNSGATAPEWGQITNGGIASAAITPAKLDASVAGDGLGGGAGTALSVNVDGSTIEINTDAVRVKDLGITTAKLADSAVTSAKIADATIVDADISGTAAIALSKLATATSGQVIVHNSSGVPTAVTMSGDTTIAAGGAVTIANNAVTEAKIVDAAVSAAKIKAEAWTSYTPTVKQPSAISNVTVNYAKYIKLGKTVHCNVLLTIGSSGGTAGNAVTVSLPVTSASSSNIAVGSADLYLDANQRRYVATAVLSSTTDVSFRALYSAIGGFYGANPTVGIALSDTISFSVTYEAA